MIQIFFFFTCFKIKLSPEFVNPVDSAAGPSCIRFGYEQKSFMEKNFERGNEVARIIV